MADIYAVKFNNSGTVTIPNCSLSGTYTLKLRFKTHTTLTTDAIIGSSAETGGSPTNFVAVYTAGEMKIRLNGVVVYTSAKGLFQTNKKYSITIAVTSGAASITVLNETDSTTIINAASATMSTAFTFDRIGDSGATSALALTGEIVKVETTNSSDNRRYISTVNTGSVWSETVGAKNGTLNGLPTDGTQWVFYESTADLDPPAFTVAPAASAIGQTSATVTATINETGSIFWVAVPQGDATPSVAQVIAGQNAAGGTPIDAGSAVATTSLSEVASGFTAATDYKFCVVAQDDEPTPNVQAAVTVVNFTTASAVDTTPPVFTVAPAVTSVSQTTATVSATIDETGSIFWVVVPDAESTPSVAQVIAGQNSAGGTPTDAGSAVGTTTLSEGVAGMTASTSYKACFVARDDESVPNVQATVTVVGFTTAAVPVGTITIPDVVNNTNTPWASAAVDAATVMPLSLGSVVVNKTGLSVTVGAELVIADAAIVTGTEYIIILKIGTAYGWYRAVAT